MGHRPFNNNMSVVSIVYHIAIVNPFFVRGLRHSEDNPQRFIRGLDEFLARGGGMIDWDNIGNKWFHL